MDASFATDPVFATNPDAFPPGSAFLPQAGGLPPQDQPLPEGFSVAQAAAQQQQQPQPPSSSEDHTGEILAAILNINQNSEAIRSFTLEQAAAMRQLYADVAQGDVRTARAFREALAQISAALPAHAASPARPPAIKLREPLKFGGKSDDVENFIRDVSVCIRLQGSAFQTDRHRVEYLSMYLEKGTALSWYNAVIRQKPHLLDNWQEFTAEFLKRFQTMDLVSKYTRKAEALTHKGPVADLVNQFQECMAYVNWSEQTKIIVFTRKLKPELRRALLAAPKRDTFDEWAPIVIEKDNELHELEVDLRREEKLAKSKAVGYARPSDRASGSGSTNWRSGDRPTVTHPFSQFSSSVPDSNGPAPMDVDAMRQVPRGPLTAEEKAYRDEHGLCRYCAGKHKLSECRKVQKKQAAEGRPNPASPAKGKA